MKIGRSRQVVIPKAMHDQLGLKPGDLLEVRLRRNQVVFTPKQLVDRELALALEDFKAGRYIGPFRTASAGIPGAAPRRRRAEMKHAFSNRFIRQYQALSEDRKARFDKQLAFLLADLRHPSLTVPNPSS